MSSSTRSQQASIEQLGFLEKLTIVPTLAYSYAAGLAAVVTSFFRGSDRRPPEMYRDFCYTFIRAITDNLSVSQIHVGNPPTDEVYAKYCKKHGLAPNSEILEDGTQAHWLGPSTAQKIVINFHGGGYCVPAAWYHFEFFYQIQQILAKQNKDAAILFLSYDLAPVAKYPRQLQQATALLNHVIYKLHKSPENIILTGDSAGANLTLAVLSHTLHPHPSGTIPPLILSSPFLGLILTSPWLTFSTGSPAYTRNATKDLLSAATSRKWSTEFMGTPSPHTSNTDNYNQPLQAPPEWWENIPVKEILILAGKDEVLVDDIVVFADTLKKTMNDITLLVAEGECHDQTNLDISFGYKEPGQQAQLVRSWIKAKL